MNGSIDVRMNDYMSKPIAINKLLGILAKYRRIWCGIRLFLIAMSPHTVQFRFATFHWCGIRLFLIAMSPHTVRFRFATSHWCGIRLFLIAMSPHTVPFRFAISHWCGIRRITKKGTGSFWKQAFSRTCSFFGVCGLIAYAQKKHHPRSCTTETVPANARSGARTLDTLIKSYNLCTLFSFFLCI